MPPSPTLTVRVSPTLYRCLELLADWTKRSKSVLANEASDLYLARELEIVKGITRGLEDMRAGRVISHYEAMRRINRRLKRAKAKHKADARKAEIRKDRATARPLA